MKQLVPEHFKTPHTFRLEWQPGRGGRLDWFTKSYKKVDENGTVFHMEGDGKGQDWEHSLHIPDFALDDAMGSKIPEEPSYLIFNTAISSTWAFPYNVPDWCPKCYDCNNPKCSCSFNPGFCNMMKTGKVALKIDSVRVYQSRDNDAHDGNPHTVGCDPVEFPTREYIKGYEYRYMRNPPFVYDDKHPLRDVKNGGGSCHVDADCGGGGVETTDVDEDWEMPGTKSMEEVMDSEMKKKESKGSGGTVREQQSPLAHMKDDGGDMKIKPKERRLAEAKEAKEETTTKEANATDEGGGEDDGLDKPPISTESLEDTEEDTKVLSNSERKPKGQCVLANDVGLFGIPTAPRKQCKCNEGYTGPHCLSLDKRDEKPGASELRKKKIDFLFSHRANPYLTKFHMMIGGILAGVFLVFLVADIMIKSRRK